MFSMLMNPFAIFLGGVIRLTQHATIRGGNSNDVAVIVTDQQVGTGSTIDGTGQIACVEERERVALQGNRSVQSMITGQRSARATCDRERIKGQPHIVTDDSRSGCCSVNSTRNRERVASHDCDIQEFVTDFDTESARSREGRRIGDIDSRRPPPQLLRRQSVNVPVSTRSPSRVSYRSRTVGCASDCERITDHVRDVNFFSVDQDNGTASSGSRSHH